jgi:hypothetical protein
LEGDQNMFLVLTAEVLLHDDGRDAETEGGASQSYRQVVAVAAVQAKIRSKTKRRCGARYYFGAVRIRRIDDSASQRFEQRADLLTNGKAITAVESRIPQDGARPADHRGINATFAHLQRHRFEALANAGVAVEVRLPRRRDARRRRIRETR